MAKRDIPPLHEIAKLEYRFKFLYFLRDLGIKSAHEPAVAALQYYLDIQAELTVGG